MTTITYEFKNLKIPVDFLNDIQGILDKTTINSRTRQSMGLSGAETLLITIAGTVASVYLVRLIDYISNNVVTSFKVKMENKGKIYDLPKNLEKFIEENG